MIGNDVFEQIEPEKRKLREDAAFVRDAGGHDHVEGGEPVGGDHQQLVAEIVNIADFSARGGLDAGEMGFSKNAASAGVACTGKMSPEQVPGILAQRDAKGKAKRCGNGFAKLLCGSWVGQPR